MWFKNITLFEFIDEFTIDIEGLHAQLSEQRFQPCGSSVAISSGWVSPNGNPDSELVYTVGSTSMLALKTQEKIVPSSVVKDQLQDKIDEIEGRDNRKLRKKEKETLKEEIYQELLPRAFTKSNTLYAYIDMKNKWLVVNTASTRKAEEFTIFLRKVLGSLKIKLPEISAIPALLTTWVLENNYPEDYVVEDNCVLRDDDSSGVIRCHKQNLISEDIVGLLDSGREIVQLSLSWKDQIAFSISDEFVIKSIKYLEVVQDQAKDIHTEIGSEQFDADFTIMVGVLESLIASLLDVFSVISNQNDIDESKKVGIAESMPEDIPSVESSDEITD